MTPEEYSLVAAVVGASAVVAAWLGHRGGDAKRDVLLMLGIGGFFVAAGVVLRVAVVLL